MTCNINASCVIKNCQTKKTNEQAFQTLLTSPLSRYLVLNSCQLISRLSIPAAFMNSSAPTAAKATPIANPCGLISRKFFHQSPPGGLLSPSPPPPLSPPDDPLLFEWKFSLLLASEPEMSRTYHHKWQNKSNNHSKASLIWRNVVRERVSSSNLGQV